MKSDQMRILILIDSLGSGGAEKSTAVLAEYLNGKHIDFRILCLDRKEVGVEQYLIKRGIPIHFVDQKSFLLQVLEVAKYIKKFKITIVHSILFRSNLRARFAKLFIHFKHIESLVSTTYSSERLIDPRVNKFSLRAHQVLDRITQGKLVDHFHSISGTVKEHYVKIQGIPEKKITVIYRGRPPLLNSEVKKSNGLPLKLINVGRNEFAKGQIYLLKAAAELRKKNYDFELDIYGRTGNSTKELREFIQESQLEDVVTLRGFDKNVYQKLPSADIFVFPSLYEGLGGALIEAQAAGLPIVCNDIPVLHEVVMKDQNALFFDVKNTSSMVDAICFLLDHPKVREKYGRVSLQNFEKKFDQETNNKKLLDLYRTL